jgi:hypothetical protein
MDAGLNQLNVIYSPFLYLLNAIVVVGGGITQKE